MTKPFLLTAAVLLCCLSVTDAAVIQSPISTVSALGHYYHAPDGAAGLIIRDAATGPNSQNANLGTYAQSSFTTTLTGQDTLVGKIVAPAGMKFVAQPIAGATNRLEFTTDWSAVGGDFGMSPTSVSFEFEGLSGATPTRIGSGFSVSGGGGKWIRFHESFSPSGAFEFTGMRVEATYDYTVSTPTARLFTPSWFEFGMRASGFSAAPDATLMTIQPTPEPAALALTGLSATLFLRRARRRF